MDVTAWELEQIIGAPSCEKIKYGKRKSEYSPSEKKNKRLKSENSVSNHEKSVETPATICAIEELKPATNDLINPVIHKEIQNILEYRNKCTLKIHGLPAKTTISELEKLAPEAKAYRLPWINRLYRCHGFAFLEFESEEQALTHKERLHKKLFGNKTLFASVGKFISECIDDYDCKMLVLYGVNYNVKKGEIARKFPSSTNISLDKTSHLNARRKPGVAYLTFASEEDAVNAIKCRHGCLLRGRKISVLFHTKQQEKSKNCLLVRGLSKKVNKDDLLAVFPQASTVRINHFRGEAQITYDLEEDCLLDQKQAKDVSIGGRKIQVFSISVRKKDKSHSLPKTGQSGSSNVDKDMPSSIVIDRSTLPLCEKTIFNLFPKAIDFCIPSQSASQNSVACVKFATLSQAKRAIKSLDGKSMRVRMANPKRMRLLGISETFTTEKNDGTDKPLYPTKVEHNKISQKVKRNNKKHQRSKARFPSKHVNS
uniref:RRM domain-containing protein n=1 Tax=Schistosoma mansoni TaxID=6183 RepID=A0A3Q0KQM8_SCHMA